MANSVHLDTDLGGDIDDLCALAMLLRWPERLHLTGITTVGELAGKRAGYARYALALEGRQDIPVAAGADVAQGYYRKALSLPTEERYWPEPVEPSFNPAEDAVQLLKKSIEQGATIIGIGPYTNLYLLDLEYPGILSQAKLFLMGGYVYPPRPGFPKWGNDYDFNMQVDVKSTKHVLFNSQPTLVPLPVTAETALRRAYLADLRKAGALGELIARQAEVFAVDHQNELKYGKTCPGLPEDIINFQYDSLACAIALGWDAGVETEEIPLAIEENDGWLVERIDPAGKPFQVVTGVDARRFNEFWLDVLTRGDSVSDRENPIINS